MPNWLPSTILLVFAIALICALWHGLVSLRLPDKAERQRRLEYNNGLPHRLVATVGDDIATRESNPETLHLWQAHRERGYIDRLLNRF